MKKHIQTTKSESPSKLARREQNAPFAGRYSSMFGQSPFTMMRRFSEDMERLFEDFGGFPAATFPKSELAFPQWTELEQKMWSPQIEVVRRGGELLVRADLPGLKREDINVEITDDALVLSGERKQETEEKGEGFYRSERNYGSFYRSIPLPEGTLTNNATASFQDGVLEIKVAIPETQTKGRKLEIQSASPEQTKTQTATHK